MHGIVGDLGKLRKSAYAAFALGASMAITLPAHALTTLYTFCAQGQCPTDAEPDCPTFIF